MKAERLMTFYQVSEQNHFFRAKITCDRRSRDMSANQRLHSAAWSGLTDAAEAALSDGADVNCVTEVGVSIPHVHLSDEYREYRCS